MNTTRSKVVIQNSKYEPVLGVAAQMLDVLGHDVSVVDGCDAAVDAATSAPTDLLVLNLTDAAEQCMRLDQLALLPKANRPKQVAILTDADDEEDGLVLRRRVPGLKVHVFVKSVHAMGLLNVIRRMPSAN